MNSRQGSALLWLAVTLVFVALGVVAFLIWGKTFLIAEGLDSNQVNSYTNAIDSANKLKNQIENTNQSDTGALNELNKLQKIR